MPSRHHTAVVASTAVGGALTLGVLFRTLRGDIIGDSCAHWPSLGTTLLYSVVYLVGLAFTVYAWRRGRVLSVRALWFVGVGMHLAAFVGLPFLSLDSLCYAAIGRLMATYHASPYRPLVETMPASDPFFAILPHAWQIIGSPYWPGFHAIARLVGSIGGDVLWLHLRLYQLVGMLSLFGSAALVTSAVRRKTESDEQSRAALALVLLSPLGLIDATLNAHNDAVMMLSVALFVWCIVRYHDEDAPRAVGALLIGLSIKASGILVLAVYVARGVFRRFTFLLRLRTLLIVGGSGMALFLTAFLLLRSRIPALNLIAALLGSPNDPVEHCTRSLETLPRALCKYVLDLPTAAFAIGVVWRGLAGLWLLVVAKRCVTRRDLLSQLSFGIFVYYLFFHGFMQSWYLLSFLPLLPFLPERYGRAAIVFIVTSVGYYAIHIPMSCVTTPAAFAAREIAEALVILVPTICTFVRASRYERSAGSAPIV